MPADFEKKFKTGRNGEVMLEKPGGGFETVATVPEGAVALAAIPSDQGLNIPQVPPRNDAAFAFVGDSRLAQMFSDPTSRRTKNSRMWWNVANTLLRQRMVIEYNGAVSGLRSDEYIGAMSGALATGAGWVVIWGVVNDISYGVTAAQSWFGWSSGAGPAGASDTHVGIRAAALKALNAGRRVILPTDPGSTSFAGDVAKTAEIVKYNRFVREFAAAYPGVVLFDVASLVWNRTATTLTWKSGYSAEASNAQTHLGQLGGYRVGTAFAQLISPLVPAVDRISHSAIEVASVGDVVVTPNPLFLTTTGGSVNGTVTGNPPLAWNLTTNGPGTSATITVQASANGNGNEVVIACTFGGGAAAGHSVVFQSRGAAAGGVAVPAAGEVFEAGGQGEIAASGSDKLIGVYSELKCDAGGFERQARDMYCDASVGVGPTLTAALVQDMMTPPLEVVSGAAATFVVLGFKVIPNAAGTATITIREPFIRKRLPSV